MHLTPEQYDVLMRPLNTARIAKRSQGGKQLSYLEAWDVKAHLIRVFGFGNWDAEVIREQFMGAFPYKDGEMVEVAWQATVRLTIHTANDSQWMEPTTYTEGAVGSATGRAGSSGIGDLHDNALKQAASDALKRCAINLGTQFGLSLYDDGNTSDVIKRVLVGAPPPPALTPEQIQREASLAKTVGATTNDTGTSGPAEPDVQGPDAT